MLFLEPSPKWDLDGQSVYRERAGSSTSWLGPDVDKKHLNGVRFLEI
jgi:hypothetical protein